MTTAQEVLAIAVRSGVAPELKKLGFIGSGQAFTLPDSRTWLLLGIQKASGSTASRLEFTINIAAVSKDTWKEKLREGAKYPAQPSPNQSYGKWAWRERIGRLMPGGQDHWWVVTPETEPPELASKIQSAIVDYALPALVQQITNP